MKLKRLAVQNVRSFGEKRTVEFHEDFTILIGPNAGGKSNLLDIVTVSVRKFFLRPWGVLRQEDSAGTYFSFTSEDPFTNFSNELPKFDGATGPLVIEFDWLINQQDIATLTSVVEQLDQLREKAKFIREGGQALNWFEQLNPAEFTPGETLQYKIEE